MNKTNCGDDVFTLSAFRLCHSDDMLIASGKERIHFQLCILNAWMEYVDLSNIYYCGWIIPTSANLHKLTICDYRFACHPSSMNVYFSKHFSYVREFKILIFKISNYDG